MEKYLIISHFILSIGIAILAKKVYQRNFFLWFLISLLVPVLGAIILFIIGFDGIYCPHCNKKIKSDSEKCPHCGFDIKKFNYERARKTEIFKEKLK